ncbi:PREDICTED: dynactin subunit 4 [Dufourea novaeangliae]|uniref:Dynactin subunit 4 n=1 Tax=Dufourea novaeangliae TaxID=178035 RepID=A0A154NY09_DUFNO|nr:PREDICTED: dynactin subunit 4 [Dufourea novaeangliae]KZC03974.1 Dynactin subunit 4 [Dufourea novaeangliae]
MSYLNQPDYVRYVCNCGSLKPISKTYFCRHCSKIRCGYCVCQEIDTHYCPNCMENFPQTEARLKKNKCSNCFKCPCCFHTLSTRAGHVPFRTAPQEGEDSKDVKTTPKKFYYLFCSLCRWTSRDAGIPDQSVATGGWPEQENPHISRISALIDYHRILASIEKQQCEKKFRAKRPYMHAMFTITSAMVRKRIGHPSETPAKNQSSDQPPPSVASEDVDELPAEIFTDPVDITKITTLEQRLQHLDVQAEKVNELRPQHREYLVRRSQRCRVCEHSVSKPDLCPQSIKFKIQLAAFYHVPEVRIVTCEPLRPGKASELLLKFCNPTRHQTQVTLLSLDTSMTPVDVASEKEDSKQENIQQGSESPNLLPSIVRQVSITEEIKSIKVNANADILLPHASLILPPRDDTAEYDDTGDTHNFQDDPKLVVWRKGNKAVIKLHVTPHENSTGGEDQSVIIGFVMQYGHVNTITTLEHKTPQKLDLKVKLYLTVGNIVSNV